MMAEIENELTGGSCCAQMFYRLNTCCYGDLPSVATNLCKTNPAIDYQEVVAVAELAGVDVEDFCMLQCAYEVAARCTSIVAPLKDGTPCHARTMDWGALFLRKLSCQVVFTRGEKELYKASTWAGYLGILTGMRKDGFSISVNFRKSTDGGTIRDNFVQGKKDAMPVGFAVRHLLQSVETYPDYASARKFMENVELMAPTYAILAGVNEGEAVSLSRERDRVIEDCTQVLDGSLENPTAGPLPITQTNTDCQSVQQHNDSKKSAPRRVCSVFYLKEHNNCFETVEDAWAILSLHPIYNAITLYSTVMCPKSGVMQTRIPDDSHVLSLLSRLKAGEHSTEEAIIVEAKQKIDALTAVFNSALVKKAGGGKLLNKEELCAVFQSCFKDTVIVGKPKVCCCC